MSFYTDASLVLIPSGIKDQKVYCAKPVDGSADLTFSRASNATRVNSSGLVEKVRTNLITYSNDFSNAAWVNSNITLTSGQQDPFGGTNGWRYLMTSIGSSYIYQDNRTVNATEMTLSFWVKSNTGSSQTFAATANSGAQASPSFTATTSWQRFSWTFTSSAGGGNVLLAYNASVNCDLLIYGAQFETDVMTDYIATTSSAVSVGPVSGLPRLDYSGGASCPSLLLEPQRTNALLNSENITITGAPSWVQYGGVTVTANDATSPDGYVNADKMDSTGGVYQQQTFTPSTAYAISVFIKKDTATSFKIEFVDQAAGYLGGNATYTFATEAITIAQSANASVTAEAVDYGNGWIRFILKMTANAAANYNYQQFNFDGGTGWVWGFQMEQGSYATSYIPTTTAVTRAVDACSKTGISSLIGQTEGTIFGEAYFQSGQENLPMWVRNSSGGGYGDFILIYTSGTGYPAAQCNFGGVNQVNIVGASTISTGWHKYAFAYKQNDFAFYCDGVLIGTDSSGSVPTCDEIYIDQYIDGGIRNTAKKQALLFKTRLSNADLATLTTI